MLDSKMITFLSLLALLCLVFLVLVGPASLVFRIRGSVPESLRPVRDGLGEAGLWMAFTVALVATGGSLWLSEVEKLTPCHLCWIQRYLMYPQVIILGVGAVGGWLKVRWISIPMVLVGAGVSTYHYLEQRFPDDISTSCSVDAPCSAVLVWKYHFLSIPAMAGIAFLTIALLLALARPASGRGGVAGNFERADELETTT